MLLRFWGVNYKIARLISGGHNARNKVYRAVKSGKLKREPCEVCGDPKSEAHHFKGYEFPLDVQWLCRKHHIKAEKIIDRFN